MKVVPATECCELDRAFVSADGLKPSIAERGAGYALGLLNGRPPISAASWHCLAKFCQDASSDSWIAQGFRLNVQGHGQHPTPDVTTDRLWIDKVRRGDDNSYAYIGRKMRVGHHSNLLNVWGAPEALDRPRHFLLQWCREPSLDGSHFRLTHSRPKWHMPAQNIIPAPAAG
jgi:hypothetical protein